VGQFGIRSERALSASKHSRVAVKWIDLSGTELLAIENLEKEK
jgi:hypothetical protein